MTIKELLQNATIKLKQHNITNPHLDAEILLGHTIQKKREYLFLHSSEKISLQTASKYYRLITKRCNDWPVAYLIKNKSFYGLNFYVNKNVLVPRPETELLIDAILKNRKPEIILDIGTGSGAIIITLAKKIGSQVKFIGSDISIKAINIAKKNATNHNLNEYIKFHQANLLDNTLVRQLKKYKQAIITANLPYLSADQIKQSPSIKKEPYLALYGGKNGLQHYQCLLGQIKDSTSNLPSNLIIYFEIDPLQKKLLEQEIKFFFPHSKTIFIKDLAGYYRFAKIQLTH